MEDRQDFVEIRIIDSGRGISKELHHKIMLPFFTTKAPGKGTGLGLGISLSIAESHGGSLALDTQCTNTCFVLTLPKRRL
jgi:two-component system NtrC family sensor kinase